MVVALALALLVAFAMEYWARYLHRAHWHRKLWFLHRSHHRPGDGRRWELNDLFSLLHAPLAILLIMSGSLTSGRTGDALLGVGLGMTLFGVGYFIVHDGLVHGRLPVQFLTRLKYFRQVRAAHIRHHTGGGAPYGLFLGQYEKPTSRQQRIAS